MKPLTLLVLSFALFVGAVGALYAFDQGAHATSTAPAGATAAVAAGPTAGEPAASARPVRQHRPHRRTVVRWAPCTGGATLENGVCVTDVVRTVTLPAPAAPAVSHSSAPASTSTGSATGRSEHEGRDDGGGGEHEGGGD